MSFEAALAEQARLRTATPEAMAYRPLLDWIPENTPRYQSPIHLTPIADLFERIRAGEQVHACISVPPRHGKTDTILHGLIWLMGMHPGLRVGYLGRDQEFVREKSRDAQRYAYHLGRGGRWTFDDWSIANGSNIKFAGILAGFTGLGFDVIVVDDPYKGRAEAESETIRNRILQSYDADIYTRQGSTPTSFMIVHTRWTPGDLIGEKTKPGSIYEYVNLPAIDDDGNALWPEVWPVERFAETRRGSVYEWESQFQGRPRPRGDVLFGPASFSDIAPVHGRFGIGIDLAYSAKTHSDWSVAVVMREHRGETTIIDMVRRQCSSTAFAESLIEVQRSYPGSPMLWYGSGTEQGTADFLRKRGVALRFEQATKDKFVRALPASAAWNNGKVHVLKDKPWTETLVQEMTAFTGVGDRHDDIVDATVAAYDALTRNAGGEVIPVHRPERRRAALGDAY